MYGLLYAALLPRHLASELRGLPAAVLAEPAVQHALQVRKNQGFTGCTSNPVLGDCLHGLENSAKCEIMCELLCRVAFQCKHM